MIGLSAIADVLGCSLVVKAERAWASATFAGVVVDLEADRALPADVGSIAYPPLPGAFVADVSSDGNRLSLLLVDDGGKQ